MSDSIAVAVDRAGSARRPAPHLVWDEPAGAWRALAACVVTLAVASGARLSFSAYFEPIERDTGLDRLTLSVAVSISAFAYGLVLPIVGRLAARYGPHRVLMGGVLLMAIAGIGVVTARRPWQFYLFVGLLPGIGFGAAGHVPGSVLLARWFSRHLGLATGVMVSAIPAGQALFVPLSAALIARYGWRITYILTGLMLAVVALPALWVWGREPEAHGPRGPAREAAAVPRAGADIWVLAGGYFGCGFTDQFVAFHLVALASDRGVGPVAAAGFLSMSLLAGLIGSLASGPLADRWPAAWLLRGLYFARAATLPLLIAVGAGRSGVLALFALVFGLTYIANQAPTTRYVRDRYGVSAVGPLTGGIALAHQVGAAAGIAAGGLSVRLTGTYESAIVATTVVALAASLLQFLLPTVRRGQ